MAHCWDVSWYTKARTAMVYGLNSKQAESVIHKLAAEGIDSVATRRWLPPIQKWYVALREYSVEAWITLPDLTDSGILRVAVFHDPVEAVEWMLDVDTEDDADVETASEGS